MTVRRFLLRRNDKLGGQTGWTNWVDKLGGQTGWTNWADKLGGQTGWTNWADKLVGMPANPRRKLVIPTKEESQIGFQINNSKSQN
jgi:hypothetical protein